MEDKSEEEIEVKIILQLYFVMEKGGETSLGTIVFSLGI